MCSIACKETPSLITLQRIENLLQQFTKEKSLHNGKQLHAIAITSGYGREKTVLINLLNLYSKTSQIKDARQLFDKMRATSALSWNMMIGAYATTGHPQEALRCYQDMQRQRMKPDHYTFSTVLGACAEVHATKLGINIHACVAKRGYEQEPFVGNLLIEFYAKCSKLEDACKVFHDLGAKDLVSWNTILSGLAQDGRAKETMEIFRQMWKDPSMKPDSFTIASVLPACAQLGHQYHGMVIHSYAVKTCQNRNVHVGSSLLNMYAKLGLVEFARQLFDEMPARDNVVWNSMLVGYVQNGVPEEALELFDRMSSSQVRLTTTTIASVISACAQLTFLKKGKELYNQFLAEGIEPDETVKSALVGLFAKCGSAEDARSVFDDMEKKDVVSWTTMISCYAQSSQGNEALKLCREMQMAGVSLDSVTISSLLLACGFLLVLHSGREIHGFVVRRGFCSAVGSNLVTMYAKCGVLKDACSVFRRTANKDTFLWNAMVAGFAMHGCGQEALGLFHEMTRSGMKPDHSTFTSVLHACAHAGLVEEGLEFFNKMKYEYKIEPELEQYGAIIDLVSRAGRLKEAEDILNRMPMQPNATVWGALLGACKMHGNVELGERAAQELFVLEPDCSANYVLLANIYSSVGRWEDAESAIGHLIGKESRS